MSDIDSIVVCGVGAAGANLLIHMLYSHPEMTFTAADFDKVEDRNITPGTQPYTKADLNRPKTQAIQKIAFMLKQKRISTANKMLKSVKDIEDLVARPKSTVIVDAFDNAESRNLFLKLGKEYNVLHIGFSADLSGEAVWNEIFTPMKTSKSDANIDVCEMTLARPFIFALTAMACLTINHFIATGEKENVYFDRYLTTRKF